MMTKLQTDRLVLRFWKEEDLDLFAKLNRDPRVMKYFPAPLSKAESDQMVKRMQSRLKERGWGFWAVSETRTQNFIGFIGLNPIEQSTLPVHFAPATEIGWRLAFDYWGKGYATEGAKAALKYGFQALRLNEFVSFTATQNKRSRRVMERIGMQHDPADDFDHPKLPEGHPLRRHVLYRISAKEWKKTSC